MTTISNLNRRAFLKQGAQLATGAMVVVGSSGIIALNTAVYFSLITLSKMLIEYCNMQRPPAEKEGKILFDAHAHFKPVDLKNLENNKPDEIEDLIHTLSAGINAITCKLSRGHNRTLTYETALGLEELATKLFIWPRVSITEIDKGRFAEINVEYEDGLLRKGYFIRGQEVFNHGFNEITTPHINCFGFEGNYQPDFDCSARELVHIIEDNGGIAELAHFGLFNEGNKKCSLLNKAQYKHAISMLDYIPIMENYNAYCQDVIKPFCWVGQANELNKEVLKQFPEIIGINVSDMHYRNEQARMSGIMIPNDGKLNIDKINTYIMTSKNIELIKKPIPRLSILLSISEMMNSKKSLLWVAEYATSIFMDMNPFKKKTQRKYRCH